jgi:hypothetical protein
MTQDEQEFDLTEAQTYLSVTTLTVNRCKHESVDQTSLWFFSGTSGNQIASATRLPVESATGDRWTVSYLQHGQPVTRRALRTLLDVVGYVMQYDKRR